MNFKNENGLTEIVKVEKTKKIDTLLEFLLGHDQRELITLEEGEPKIKVGTKLGHFKAFLAIK